MKLNLYSINFVPMFPVPSGLIILAHSSEEAMEIASKTLEHTKPEGATLIKSDEPGVVFFESGDY